MLTTFDTEVTTSLSFGEKVMAASAAGVLLGATSRAGQKITDGVCSKVGNWWNDRKEEPPQRVMIVGVDPTAPTQGNGNRHP